jgi:hypothetical protein
LQTFIFDAKNFEEYLNNNSKYITQNAISKSYNACPFYSNIVKIIIRHFESPLEKILNDTQKFVLTSLKKDEQPHEKITVSVSFGDLNYYIKSYLSLVYDIITEIEKTKKQNLVNYLYSVFYNELEFKSQYLFENYSFLFCSDQELNSKLITDILNSIRTLDENCLKINTFLASLC